MLLLVTYGDRDVNKAIFVFVGCLLLSACDKKPEAPFGFEWGQSLQSIKSMHLPGYFEIPIGDGITQVLLKDAPKKKPLLNEYFVYTANGLGVIAAEGRSDIVDLSTLSGPKEITEKYNVVLEQIANDFDDTSSARNRRMNDARFNANSHDDYQVLFKKGGVIATLKIQRQGNKKSHAWVSLTYSISKPQ